MIAGAGDEQGQHHDGSQRRQRPGRMAKLFVMQAVCRFNISEDHAEAKRIEPERHAGPDARKRDVPGEHHIELKHDKCGAEAQQHQENFFNRHLAAVQHKQQNRHEDVEPLFDHEAPGNAHKADAVKMILEKEDVEQDIPADGKTGGAELHKDHEIIKRQGAPPALFPETEEVAVMQLFFGSEGAEQDLADEKAAEHEEKFNADDARLLQKIPAVVAVYHQAYRQRADDVEPEIPVLIDDCHASGACICR